MRTKRWIRIHRAIFDRWYDRGPDAGGRVGSWQDMSLVPVNFTAGQIGDEIRRRRDGSTEVPILRQNR